MMRVRTTAAPQYPNTTGSKQIYDLEESFNLGKVDKFLLGLKKTLWKLADANLRKDIRDKKGGQIPGGVQRGPKQIALGS